MLTVASQIVLCLILAALIGMIIGYLLGKNNCPKETYRAATPADPYTDDDGECDDDEEEPTAEPAALMTHADAASDEADASPAAEETTEEATEETVEEAAAEEAAEEVVAAVETKDTGDAKEPSKDADAGAAEYTPTDEDKPETLLDAPRGGKGDNLKRIKGIGVKIESLLNSIGVYHFDQIAAWTEKEAAWIDHKVAFPGRALRDDWIGQAKLLAKGLETEFSKRVDKGEVASSQ